MNRSNPILIGLLLAVVSITGAQAQLLDNGDLELPPLPDAETATGWTLIEPSVDSGGGAVSSAAFASFGNHTLGGSRGLWFRSFEGGLGPMSPTTVDARLEQSVLGVPGGEYTLSAWFRLEENYSGINPVEPTATLLILEFHGLGGLLGVVDLDIDAVYDTGVGGIDTWQRFEVMGEAPVGTTSVLAAVSMVDGVIQTQNPQSAFADDIELVGPPGTVLSVPTVSEIGALILGLALLAVAFRRLGLTRRPAPDRL